ncbi:hypothetical protein PFISCL1PPCAC_21468, partial [Pristionchus fissidentatus]
FLLFVASFLLLSAAADGSQFRLKREYNWNNYPEGFAEYPSPVRTSWGSPVQSGYGGAWNQQRPYSRADPCTPWMRLMGRCPVQQSWYYPNFDESLYRGA